MLYLSWCLFPAHSFFFKCQKGEGLLKLSSLLDECWTINTYVCHYPKEETWWVEIWTWFTFDDDNMWTRYIYTGTHNSQYAIILKGSKYHGYIRKAAKRDLFVEIKTCVEIEFFIEIKTCIKSKKQKETKPICKGLCFYAYSFHKGVCFHIEINN